MSASTPSGMTVQSTTKTKHFNIKHPKKKLYRAEEPLMSVFMWGINHTVRELSHISIPVMLMPDDFRAFTKIKIDNHAFNKENLPSHFKVRADIYIQLIYFLNEFFRCTVWTLNHFLTNFNASTRFHGFC